VLNKTYDQKSGLFWFVAGMVIIYFSIGYGIGSLGAPGPGYISFLMGIIMSVLSGIMVIRDVRGKTREPLSRLFQGNWLRVVLTIVALLLYTILLPYLGFIVLSMILIYTLILLAGKRNHLTAGVTAVIVSLLSYYVFSVLLQVNLPEGLLGDLLKGRG
jgi:putative tricarboxylic transport membrane protein